MNTIVLYGGDFGNCHLRVDELPDFVLVEQSDPGSLWSCYKPTDLNQNLTENTVYNFQFRSPRFWIDEEECTVLGANVMKLTRSAFV